MARWPPDDRAVREIEDALGIAERAGNDIALSFARMALGVALAHRHTAAQRDRGLARSWPRSATCSRGMPTTSRI